MKEKYEEYKKSKEYKKHVIVNIFLVFVFLAIVFCGYLFYKEYHKAPSSNAVYTYEIEDNTIILSSKNKVINTYNCSNCEVYKSYFNNGLILIKDKNGIYLYDLVNNTKKTSYYTEFYFVYNDSGKDIKNAEYFVVKDSFNKWGVLDKKGSITINVSYDIIGMIDNNELTNYSYKDNFITVQKGKTWGVLGLNNSMGIIDFQYDNIILSDYEKIAVKEKDLWYLVDKNNKKLITTGYNSINIFTKYEVVTDSNQLYIVDDEGNILTNKISLIIPVDVINKTGANIYIKDNVLNIEILDVNNKIVQSYTYNETTNTLN